MRSIIASFIVLAIVFTGLVLKLGSQGNYITFKSFVNNYEAKMKGDYLLQSETNPNLPKYLSPCGDQYLVIERGDYSNHTGISSLDSQVFRTQNDLIIIGIGCYTEDKSINPWEINIRKYDIQTLELKSQTVIEDSSSNYKSYFEDGKVYILLAAEVISKLEIRNEDLSQSPLGIVTVEEYRSVESKDIFSSGDLKQQSETVTDITLNPQTGNKSIGLNQIPALN